MKAPDLSIALDVERAVIGSILQLPAALSEVPQLETDDFSHPHLRAAFSAIRNLEAQSHPIDSITVSAMVAKWDGHGSNVTSKFLDELVLATPPGDNLTEYARQLREYSLARRVRVALGEVMQECTKRAVDGSEVLAMAQAAISKLGDDQPDDTTTVANLAKRRFQQLETIAIDKAQGKQAIAGYPTGVAKLDEKIGGVQPGIVTIVAARPGMGKSSMGLAIAHANARVGIGVHVFSLEDTEEAYADRVISRASSVPAERLRNADIQRGDAGSLALAVSQMRGMRWLIDGRSGLTADEIVRYTRRHARENQTKVVIVDYVQLVKPRHGISRHDALTEIVTTLADAAKQDRMAYVVMSQLNRQVEQRQDKRPQLSDLRESGSLEERAKCVIGLYRGAYYSPDPSAPADYGQGQSAPSREEHASTIQILVLKNSNGRTGLVRARWRGETTEIS